MGGPHMPAAEQSKVRDLHAHDVIYPCDKKSRYHANLRAAKRSESPNNQSPCPLDPSKLGDSFSGTSGCGMASNREGKPAQHTTPRLWLTALFLSLATFCGATGAAESSPGCSGHRLNETSSLPTIAIGQLECLSWESPRSWEPNTVPAIGDKVVIDSACAVSQTHPSDKVSRLVVKKGAGAVVLSKTFLSNCPK